MQCYGYGFAKIEDKSNKYYGAYVHPDFQRDDPTRACTIQRRSTLGSDRRFKKAKPIINDHQIHHGDTSANEYLNGSFSSLSWLSSCDSAKPEVRLDSTVSVSTSASLIPSQMKTFDDWFVDLQMAFSSSPSSHNVASPSRGMLSIVEFKSLFEPRPIELMIKK